MGANLVAAHSITAVECVKNTFDKESGVSVATSGYSTRSNNDDIRRVEVNQKLFQNQNVFLILKLFRRK